MQVIDILTETKKNKVDEGPIRLLKRTLGKNTAMGKAAQLDVELDKEVKNIYKDYYAVTKQDPKKQGEIAASIEKHNNELETLKKILSRVDTYRRNTFANLRDIENIDKILAEKEKEILQI